MLGHGPLSDLPLSDTQPFATATPTPAVFRLPIITPRREIPAAQQGFIAPNLLLTTLAAAAVAVMPFRVLDQPNPVRRAAAAQQPSHARSSYVPAPAGPAALPVGRLLEQPNPLTRMVRAGEESSLGTLPWRFPVAAAPFMQEDQPRPTTRLVYVVPETSLGRLPSSIPAVVPFRVEQPNPAPAKRAQQPDPTANLLTTTLVPAAPAAAPFRLSDQPNPVRRALAAQQPTHARSSYDAGPPVGGPMPVGRLLDQPNPLQWRHMRGQEFVAAVYTQRPIDVLLLPQRDFQNPTLARRVQQPQLYPNLLTTTLFAAPPPPFKQTEQPNPTLAKRINRGEQAQVLPLTTLYVPPQAMPIGLQRDFPNPLPIKLRDVHFQFDGTPLPNALPPPVTPPVTVPSTYVGGGGMGGGKAKWWDESEPKKKRKDIFKQYGNDVRQAFAEPTVIRDVYAELQKLETAPPDVAAFTAPDGATDWNAAARDLETVSRILQAWRAEERRREIADDDEEMMLF